MKKRFFAIWFLSLLCLPLLAEKYNIDNATSDWEDQFYRKYEKGDYSSWSNPEWPVNGAGTKEDPYRIEQAMQLACLAYWVNVKHWTGEGKYFLLTNDLNLYGYIWMPIGVDAEHPFRGYFNGGNHTVSDMRIDIITGSDSKNYYYGLFGYCEAIIWNLNINSSTINIHQFNDSYPTRWLCAGLLCGDLSYYRGEHLTIYGAIYNCRASGSISGELYDSGDRSCIGGLVGYADNPVSIYHCHTNFTSDLRGAFDVGGIVGRNSGYNSDYLSYWKWLIDHGVPVPLETFVYDCTADVNISLTKHEIDYYHAGGICGTNEGNIEACASSGSVTASTDGTAAGICGRNMGNIVGCVSMVTATGGYNVGGIVGKNEDRAMQYFGSNYTYHGQIHYCAFSGHINGTNSEYCGGIVARSPGEYVDNSLFLGTMQASINSKYTSPIQQKTDGESGETPKGCFYDENLFLLTNSDLGYEWEGIGKRIDVLTSGSALSFSDAKLSSIKNVCFGDPSYDVIGVQWVYANGFYPRLSLKDNNTRTNPEEGTLTDDVIRKAYVVTGETVSFATPLFTNYAWLTSVPVSLTKSQFAYHLDNAIPLASKSGSGHTASYSLPSGQTWMTVSGTTATPKESGNVLLTISDASSSLSKQMLLTVVYNNRQWDGKMFSVYDGQGTAANPYLIRNAGQFANMICTNQPNQYYKLTQDIWFNDGLLSDTGTPNNGKYKWDRQGNVDNYFWNAHLDGDGHLVRGMYVDYACGIFTALLGDASIENTAFVNTYVGTIAPAQEPLKFAGLIAGEISPDAIIRNCLIDGVINTREIVYLTTGGVFGRLNRSDDVKYATIEDCVVSVAGSLFGSRAHGIGHAFGDVDDNSLARIRRILLLNNSEPQFGIGYYGHTNASMQSQVYFPLGYMTNAFADNPFTDGLSVAAMTNGSLFANEDRWLSEEGRFPMLKSFANTDYGKLLSLPIYTTETNSLKHMKTMVEFEGGAANWEIVDDDVIDVVPDLEVMQPLKAARTYLVRTLGEAKIVTPITVSENFTEGIQFEDENAQQFCDKAFGDHNGKVNLSEVIDVNSSAFASAMTAQYAYANNIEKFPELRYFMKVEDLSTIFQNKSKLKEVTLPVKMKNLPDDLFRGCSSLTSFTIPVSITSMGATHPFNGSGVENFSTEKRHPTMTARDGVLMSKEGNQLICYPNGRTGTDITLSGAVERINSNAIYKINGASNIYLDAPTYESYTELGEDGITSYNGELMNIYVKDATCEMTENERSNALTGEGKGVLLEQFKEADCWKDYAQAGKLKRYYELEVSDKSQDATNNCYWATMYIGFDTQLPEDLTPYIVDKEKTKTSADKLVLRKINRKVPMLTPVVIKASAPGKYKLFPSVEAKLPELPMYENLLDGTKRDGLSVNQAEAIDGGCLTLGRNKQGKVGFFIYKGTKKIPGYRAYLSVNKVSEGRLLEISNDEETTAVESVAKSQEPMAKDQYYDLQGRTVNGQPLKKGLYIQNGKKVIVK